MIRFQILIRATPVKIDLIQLNPSFSPRRWLHILCEPEANTPIFHHFAAQGHGTADFF
jgi:hypothetical protein